MARLAPSLPVPDFSPFSSATISALRNSESVQSTATKLCNNASLPPEYPTPADLKQDISNEYFRMYDFGPLVHPHRLPEHLSVTFETAFRKIIERGIVKLAPLPKKKKRKRSVRNRSASDRPMLDAETA